MKFLKALLCAAVLVPALGFAAPPPGVHDHRSRASLAIAPLLGTLFAVQRER